MSSVLTFNKENFVQKFLTPISKLADNVSLVPQDNNIYAVCASQDGSIVLHASYKIESNTKGLTSINIPDVKKFVRLLECINNTDLNLNISSNHITHSSNGFNFNYYLLEDSYMQRCPVNPEKIKSLKYNSAFILSNSKFNDILKGSSITTDSDKLYFFTKDQKVYAELNDLERQNINNITYLVADKFVGEDFKNKLPLNLENIRLLAGLKNESFTVKINNDLKVTLFEIEDNDIQIKFIISALVK